MFVAKIHNMQAFSVRFNPDNHFLAAAGGHGTVGSSQWDALLGHRGAHDCYKFLLYIVFGLKTRLNFEHVM